MKLLNREVFEALKVFEYRVTLSDLSSKPSVVASIDKLQENLAGKTHQGRIAASKMAERGVGIKVSTEWVDETTMLFLGKYKAPLDTGLWKNMFDLLVGELKTIPGVSVEFVSMREGEL